jgi:hypothetical protein
MRQHLRFGLSTSRRLFLRISGSTGKFGEYIRLGALRESDWHPAGTVAIRHLRRLKRYFLLRNNGGRLESSSIAKSANLSQR